MESQKTHKFPRTLEQDLERKGKEILLQVCSETTQKTYTVTKIVTCSLKQQLQLF